jgi:hypothetical protein
MNRVHAGFQVEGSLSPSWRYFVLIKQTFIRINELVFSQHRKNNSSVGPICQTCGHCQIFFWYILPRKIWQTSPGVAS